ncbi:MAG: hypothetical protein ACREA0_07795, partial [bacterium]
MTTNSPSVVGRVADGLWNHVGHNSGELFVGRAGKIQTPKSESHTCPSKADSPNGQVQFRQEAQEESGH